MDADAAASRAVFALAVLLFLAAVPRGAPRPAPCADPRELWARDGHTRAVACDGGERGLPALRGPARQLFGQPLDPNRADAASLESLPGIGPARARAIVAERRRRPFDSLADLTRVRGIGPRTVEALAPWAAVEHLQENR